MTDDLVKQSFYDGYQEGLKCGEAKSMNRIEQLEAALRLYMELRLYMDMMAANKIDIPHTWEVARAAIAGEKKDD
jgi:hypothetical protein